jgi:hypothetical protein
VIQPLLIPLDAKIKSLKIQSENEGHKLKKGEINEAVLGQVQGYLYLIGDFLKGCEKLRQR